MWPIPFHHLLLFSGFSSIISWSSTVIHHLGTTLLVQYHMTQLDSRSVYKTSLPSPSLSLRFDLVEYFTAVDTTLLLLLLLALFNQDLYI